MIQRRKLEKISIVFLHAQKRRRAQALCDMAGRRAMHVNTPGALNVNFSAWSGRPARAHARRRGICIYAHAHMRVRARAQKRRRAHASAMRHGRPPRHACQRAAGAGGSQCVFFCVEWPAGARARAARPAGPGRTDWPRRGAPSGQLIDRKKEGL